MDSFGMSLGEPWAGRQGLPVATEGGCFSWWFSLPLTDSALDRDMSRTWHTSVLFVLYHSAKDCCNFLKDIDLTIKKHLILYLYT